MFRSTFSHFPKTMGKASRDPLVEGVMHEKSAAFYVLEICRSRGRQFSLRDIVSRIHELHPELTEEFPNIWGELVRRKKVRVCYTGDTLLYEVVMTNQGHHQHHKQH